ncbi:MAG: DUF4493 domain-containing protein [Muribaculum sp.]|nr:DUF4493 domain-containing protein [Muribaculum sp.]
MSKLRFGLPLMGAAAVAAGLVGCADESPWGNSSNEKGTIDLSLITNSDIKSATPVFVGDDETRATGDPNDLSTYVSVPTADDFKIKLEKNDGSFNQTWNSLAAFKRDAENQFVAGTYTLTAFYGEKNQIAFNNPYFETSETFTVLANETHKLDLNAGLSNSMVKINFTDDFKNYMSDYYVGIRSEGQTDEFKYQKNEPRPVFVQPESTNLTVHFTTRDTGVTNAKNIGQFVALAKTLHNLTLDVRTVDGKTSLGVLFNDTLETENVFIDLSDCFKDMVQAPVVTCNGFDNGATINLLEGTESQSTISMDVVAEAGIKSAIMTISTNGTAPEWGREIDLIKATPEQQEQIENAGIKATSFFKNPENAASLDLTQYGKSLSHGTYTVSLQITDKNDNISEPAKVIFDFEQMRFANAAGTANYASTSATLNLDYNGLNPADIRFTAPDKNGNDAEVRVESYSEANSTRAFEAKTYTYHLTLPTPMTGKEVTVKAYNKNNDKQLGTGKISLTSTPNYSITQVDAFSKFAYMKVDAEVSILPIITENIRLDNNNLFIYSRDTANGILTVTGPLGNDGKPTELQPGREYSPQYSIFAGDFSYGKRTTFKTETMLDVPNGEFSTPGETIESGKIDTGGEYRVSVLGITDDYQNWSSYSYTLPSGWATVNALTTYYTNSNNRNTWFEVPSSWVDSNGQAVMRNVGYNHNGTAPARTGGNMNREYYCENSPSDSQLEKAAGEIFLGSYSFNGSATRTDGIGFASRPSSISFEYTYELKAGKSDNGYAYVEVCDASGNKIGSAEPFAIPETSSITQKTINITYNKFGGSAAFLKIGFKSSNQTTPPIYIPTGSELDEDVKNIRSDSSKTIATNTYKAVATGSVLTIDNVKANYTLPIANTAKAPKRKATTKRK